MARLSARLARLEAIAPSPPPSPGETGEEREGEAVWRYLSACLLATMPEPLARRVVAEVEAGERSPLARRAMDAVRDFFPEPWTCSLAGCECASAGSRSYAPLALPEAVCAALDSGRATYDAIGRATCSTCAFELPRPWDDPCPVCGSAPGGRGYLATLAGARPPGAPAPAPVAALHGGLHTVRFDIRHPASDPSR